MTSPPVLCTDPSPGHSRRSLSEGCRGACWCCSRGVTSPPVLRTDPYPGHSLCSLSEGCRGVCCGRKVSVVAALCPSPEGALATGRERGMTGGHGVRCCKRGCCIVPLSRRSASDREGEGNDHRSWGEVLRARGAECALVQQLVGAAHVA